MMHRARGHDDRKMPRHANWRARTPAVANMIKDWMDGGDAGR